jgi:hypothetical protein
MAAAMKDILIPAGIAAFVVLCAIVAARRTPQDWEPRRLHEARHRASLSELSDLLDAVDRGDLHEGHYEDGSAP